MATCISGEMNFGGVSKQYVDQLVKARSFKAHIETPVNPTINSWTSFSGFTLSSSESLGDCMRMEEDTSTFTILKDGFYSFGGCIHAKNDSPGQFSDAIILGRLLENNVDEVRCSQVGNENLMQAASELSLPYAGTAYWTTGDTITLQYYTNEVDLTFTSNSLFDTQIAATFWIVFQGENLDRYIK